MDPSNDRRLAELTFVAFDVETTGLDPQADAVVEVGAVRFGREGISGEYQRLINPGRPIPQDATAIHGITDADVASCPPFAAVLTEILAFFGDFVLIAHNAPFDIGFFDAAFARNKIAHSSNPILCTLQLARSTFPALGGHGLESLVAKLGVAEGEHHRALADAGYVAGVFDRCLGWIGAGWNMTLGELSAHHGPFFRFGASSDAGVSPQTLELVKKAMGSGSSVRIEYRSGSGKTTVREITPISINESGGRPKVVAFCHLRGERRTFRLDCIKKIE